MSGASPVAELTESGEPAEQANAAVPPPAVPPLAADDQGIAADLCFNGVWTIAEVGGDLGAMGGLVLRMDADGWRLRAGEHLVWAEGWDEVGRLIVDRAIRLPDGTTGALVQQPDRRAARGLAVPGQEPSELAESLRAVVGGSGARIDGPQRDLHPVLLAPAIAVIGAGVAYLLLAAGHVVHP